METAFTCRFWGVRGTTACPGQPTIRYGGNTACLELRCGTQGLILDEGTGIRALGNLMVREEKSVHAHILLSHTHIDHIVGLPFFKPAYRAANRLEIWAGHLATHQRSLQSVLNGLMEPPYFPVPLDVMHACIAFHDFRAGATLDLGSGISVKTISLNHPGGSTAFRIEYGGRSLCYVTDTEHPSRGRDSGILQFVAGSDVMIYDAAYDDSEYPRFVSWGHSSWQEGARLSRLAGVGQYIPFHHDPEHDDQFLDSMDAELQIVRPGSIVAREGVSIVI